MVSKEAGKEVGTKLSRTLKAVAKIYPLTAKQCTDISHFNSYSQIFFSLCLKKKKASLASVIKIDCSHLRE